MHWPSALWLSCSGNQPSKQPASQTSRWGPPTCRKGYAGWRSRVGVWDGGWGVWGIGSVRHGMGWAVVYLSTRSICVSATATSTAGSGSAPSPPPPLLSCARCLSLHTLLPPNPSPPGPAVAAAAPANQGGLLRRPVPRLPLPHRRVQSAPWHHQGDPARPRRHLSGQRQPIPATRLF